MFIQDTTCLWLHCFGNFWTTGWVCGDICFFVIWEAAGFWSCAQLLCFSWTENFRNRTFWSPRSDKACPEGKEWSGPQAWYQESRRVCRDVVMLQGEWLGAPQWQHHFWGPCAGLKFLPSCSSLLLLSSCSLCFQPFCGGVKVLYVSLHSVPLCPTLVLR